MLPCPSYCPVFNRTLFVVIVVVVNELYILDINPSSYILLANVFSSCRPPQRQCHGGEEGRLRKIVKTSFLLMNVDAVFERHYFPSQGQPKTWVQSKPNDLHWPYSLSTGISNFSNPEGKACPTKSSSRGILSE